MDIVQRDIEFEHQALLVKAGETIDARVGEIAGIGAQLVNSPELSQLCYLSEPFLYSNTSKLVNARNSLPKYATFNDFIFDYFLFFNNGQFAMNDQSVYSYEDFYQLYLHDSRLDYDAWLSDKLNFSAAFGECRSIPSVYLKSGSQEALNLIEFFYPFYSYGASDGCAVIFVREDTFLDLLPEVDGSLIVQDLSGQVLISKPADGTEISELQTVIAGTEDSCVSVSRRIGGQKMVVTQAVCAKAGLRITIAVPQSIVFSRLTHLKNAIMLYSLLAFVLAAIISYALSVRNARFIQNLAGAGGEQLLDMSYSKAFRTLESSFHDILNANEAMAQTLEKQQPYMCHTFLMRLIHGDFVSEEEALSMSQDIGVLKDSADLRVVLFRLQSASSANNASALQLITNCKAVISLTVLKMEPDALYSDHSEEECVLLITGENTESRISNLLECIRAELPEAISEVLFVYVGDIVHQLTEVVLSYDNAASLVYAPSSDGQFLIYYDKEKERPQPLFYSQDMQHHLINCTMSGDEGGVLNLLALLKERNFSDANVPTFMRQLFIDNLLNTVLQVSALSNISAEDNDKVCGRIKDFLGMSLSAQIHEIDQLFILLCQVIQQKNAKHQNFIKNVMAYIDMHYSDCDLSLTSVAEQFGISESYLSYAFKMQSNVNFFIYLENLRITRAKELLRQTNLKIGDIAQQVGYASTNSFCRAFKRSTGDSASSYRNSIE